MNAKSDRRRPAAGSRREERSESGFTLLETLMALLVMLVIMGGVMQSLIQLSRTQTTVWNRANMHGSVRSATELLQQEVGQAGRVSLPSATGLPITNMWSAVTILGSQPVTVSSTAGMFVGEQLVVDAGPNEETVTVTQVNSLYQFTANFTQTHPASAGLIPVGVRGGFASGVVPCRTQADCPFSTLGGATFTDGSTGSVLKIYGDVNGDGNMKYIEYVCDATVGRLYRNVMAFDAVSKPEVNPSQVLLSNILPNPPPPGSTVPTPCFTYDQKTVNGVTYVINVAISLTTETQMRDPVTREFQRETKALLNVAPRNVFDAWQLASIGATGRIQPMPPTVANLLRPPGGV